MSPWIFPITLEAEAAEPVYLQIARVIRAEIARGRLAPCDALPGSRTLAKTLGVHRNTVLAAFRELQAEGWLASEGRSTRVSEVLPPQPVEARATPPGHIGFPVILPPEPILANLPVRPGTLVFNTGLPDLRMVPAQELARAYGRALRNRALLGYGDAMGEPRLRAGLGGLLSGARGLAIDPQQIMVVNGSQGGLDLVVRTLLQPGDRVAVEDPGYGPAWVVLRAAGAELVPIPVDAEGLQVEVLAARAAEAPIRALYCTPHHQFPTTVTLSRARRTALLELAQRHAMAILEDDYDFEFPFEGTPVLPLASADTGGVVVYMGSLSKILAPGLRLGFVTGPHALVEAMARRRYNGDRQGDHVLERAIAELLEDGLLQRHVRKMRLIYQGRRDVFAEEVTRELSSVASFELPSGGLSLWLRLDPALDAEAWAQRAERMGVAFYPGRHYDFRGQPRPNLRLGFASLNEQEIREAVRRMKRAL